MAAAVPSLETCRARSNSRLSMKFPLEYVVLGQFACGTTSREYSKRDSRNHQKNASFAGSFHAS
jgi:hypothetical protein